MQLLLNDLLFTQYDTIIDNLSFPNSKVTFQNWELVADFDFSYYKEPNDWDFGYYSDYMAPIYSYNWLLSCKMFQDVW